MTPAAVCPACGEQTGIGEDVVLGEVVWCMHCGAELEVIGLSPLLLELFEEEEK
jgi:lysine biosynthesis protein LysW